MGRDWQATSADGDWSKRALPRRDFLGSSNEEFFPAVDQGVFMSWWREMALWEVWGFGLRNWGWAGVWRLGSIGLSHCLQSTNSVLGPRFMKGA
jgi:hypothetical protein